MCLILIAFRSHLSYKLIIAGNRDEYHDRPTAPACFWKEAMAPVSGIHR
ncbi:MAG: NRDE family protein [Deltaproteobacteria bacterium]|nr:NRDE family protein [Deltaproteobacteria bacterium]